MNSTTFPAIPLDTAKAARSIFGRSNFYLVAGDQVDHLIDGLFFGNPDGRFQVSTRTLAMLHLITIFQFVEAIPDQLAADALRERLDWKYALHLPLNYPGLEADALCEFRKWMLSEQTNLQHLQMLLVRMSEIMDFTGNRGSNLEPGQVINGVCQISRLDRIWELLTQVLIAVKTRYPDWLLGASLPHWHDRYSIAHRKLNMKADKLEMHALVHKVGADGLYLLEAAVKSGVPGLAELPELLKLRQVWEEQYVQIEGKVQWRKEACEGCSLHCKLPQSLINSNHNVPQ